MPGHVTVKCKSSGNPSVLTDGPKKGQQISPRLQNIALAVERLNAEEGIALQEEKSLIVASFYKFVELPDYRALRQPIRQICEDNVMFLTSTSPRLAKIEGRDSVARHWFLS